MIEQDIHGSMVHSAMLGKQGIMRGRNQTDIEGLKGILADIEAGKIHFSQDYEDIHMNVEQILTERIGDAGKRLHTARSMNESGCDWICVLIDEEEIVAIKKEISIHGSTLRERKEQSGNCYAGLYNICSVHSRLHLDII